MAARHRFEQARASESGFTLIELLTTIMILALLSAIAIPYFLSQREKAWVAQLQAALRNGATAEETVMAMTGAYSPSETVIRDDGGWRTAPEVSLTQGTRGGHRGYCLEGTHVRLRSDHRWKVAHFSSQTGTLRVGPCPGVDVDGDGEADGEETEAQGS